MVVDAAFRAGRPQALFRLNSNPSSWDVAPDGERFLVMKAPAAQPDVPKLEAVENWFEELRRRVPVKK